MEGKKIKKQKIGNFSIFIYIETNFGPLSEGYLFNFFFIKKCTNNEDHF
jgi:hypothetical protein